MSALLRIKSNNTAKIDWHFISIPVADATGYNHFTPAWVFGCHRLNVHLQKRIGKVCL
ncbi:hypothetical protein ADICYQ_3126 [Cyclobacterium qasimii M12-11B]|uniref:Uncharacterized protein n=1 Tax=Cyclobacterium qasimii M12-11B TaxID=641524 RepID=S7WMV7_9BACT|nr:hypothetical protein ADICYQ_3126 [Cyclobacterium qasimii M12-11B]